MLKLGNILEGVLLSEDKLYGRKLIDIVTKKIGDNSEATLNQLAIAGLFRNSFGDIQQLSSKEELNTASEAWYNDMIANMVKTSAFTDAEDTAKQYLNAYIKNIASLGSNARPFSIKNIERSLVDVVNNHSWIDENPNTNIGDTIYSPHDDDIQYEDENILILDTDTKAKCVKYGAGESWCISKPELNYYNTYRITDGATPYYVLQKKLPENDKLHKLVIMVYGRGRYAIADRDNSPQGRHGASNQTMSWLGIEDDIHGLTGLEEYFPYREVTDDEARYNEILNSKTSQDNLMAYIVDTTRGLVINGSQVTPEDFIRDYAAQTYKFTEQQLASLSEPVMDSLIESGYFASTERGHYNKEVVTEKQLRRIMKIRIENNVQLQYFEIELLPDRERYAYIEEHVRDGKIRNFLEDSSNPKKVMKLFGRRAIEIMAGMPPYETQQMIINANTAAKGRLIMVSLDTRLKYPNLAYGGDDAQEVNAKYNMIYLKYSDHPKKVMERLGHAGQVFLSTLDDINMENLLDSANNSDEIAEMYIDIKGVSNLGAKPQNMLFTTATEPQAIYDKLGKMAPMFFSQLRAQDLMALVRDAKSPIKLAEVIGMENIKKMILKLDNKGLIDFFSRARGNAKNRICMLILGAKGASLDNEVIKNMLQLSSNGAQLIEPIITAKGSEMDGYTINSLMHHTIEPDRLALRMIDLVGTKLDSMGIQGMLKKAPSTEALTAKIFELFGDELPKNVVNVILDVAPNTEGAANAIIAAMGDNLSVADTFALLNYTRQPNLVAKKLGEGPLNALRTSFSALGSDGIKGLAVNAQNPSGLIRVMNQIMNHQTVESITTRLRLALLTE